MNAKSRNESLRLFLFSKKNDPGVSISLFGK